MPDSPDPSNDDRCKVTLDMTDPVGAAVASLLVEVGRPNGSPTWTQDVHDEAVECHAF